MISIYVFRPLSSQIGACVSEQSTVISGREVEISWFLLHEHYCWLLETQPETTFTGFDLKRGGAWKEICWGWWNCAKTTLGRLQASPSSFSKPSHDYHHMRNVGNYQDGDCWNINRVEPQTIEFWQGQSNRIHDRLRFRANTYQLRLIILEPQQVSESWWQRGAEGRKCSRRGGLADWETCSMKDSLKLTKPMHYLVHNSSLPRSHINCKNVHEISEQVNHGV